MKNEKILICYWGRQGGGAQYSKEIAKEFVSQNYNNTYLSFSNQSDIIDYISKLSTQSFHIDTYKNKTQFIYKTFLLPFLIIRFIKYIKKNDINTIYSTMLSPWTIFFIPFLKFFKIKHIATVHDASIHPGDCKIFNLTNKILFKYLDSIIVLSDFVKKELLKNYNLKNTNIIKSVHGLFNYKNLQFSQKFFKKDEYLRIVFFGRILPYKGLSHLLDAIIQLEKKNLNIILEIYGSGSIEQYQNKLNMIKNLKLENRWIKDDEIFKIFNEACLNISPYVEASQSGVIPLALGCGIPSIVTDIGGLKEQIISGKTGIVIPIENISYNLFNVISSLYEDREKCQYFSFEAYKYASIELSWKKICYDLHENIFKK